MRSGWVIGCALTLVLALGGCAATAAEDGEQGAAAQVEGTVIPASKNRDFDKVGSIDGMHEVTVAGVKFTVFEQMDGERNGSDIRVFLRVVQGADAATFKIGPVGPQRLDVAPAKTGTSIVLTGTTGGKPLSITCTPPQADGHLVLNETALLTTTSLVGGNEAFTQEAAATTAAVDKVFGRLRAVKKVDVTVANGRTVHGRVYEMANADGAKELTIGLTHPVDPGEPVVFPAMIETKIVIDAVSRVEAVNGSISVEATEPSAGKAATKVKLALTPRLDDHNSVIGLEIDR